MCATVDDDSSHIYKFLPLSKVKIYLQTCEPPLHRSTLGCNILGPLLICASTVQRSTKHQWPLINTHCFHVKITSQYCLAQRSRIETLKLKICHYLNLVCEIPRSFDRASPSNFRTQGSFIHINSGKIFERDLLSSDSVAKSATQKLGFSETEL